MGYSSAQEQREGLTGWWQTPEQNAAIRRRRAQQQQRTHDLFNAPGAVGSGIGPAPASAVGGGIDPQMAQDIYEAPGGRYEVARLASRNFDREGALGAFADWRQDPATQQLYTGITDWMADPQAWSDTIQRTLENSIREQGQQQLGQQQYEIGRSMARSGKGDSGTRMKLEQQAASETDRRTLEQQRQAKINREMANLQSKAQAYSAGLSLGNIGKDAAAFIAHTYLNSPYDPSGVQEMEMVREFMPEVMDMGQVATQRQQDAMWLQTIVSALSGIGGARVFG